MPTDAIPCTPDEFESYFAALLAEAATTLLTTLDPAMRQMTAPLSSGTIDSASVVGFVGAEVRGLISVAHTDEQKLAALDEDRVSELANQLAGRVKNLLGRVGVGYEVAPPLLLRGRQLSLASRQKETRLDFSSPTARYSVVAALEILQPVALRAVAAEELPFDEGEMLLF